MVCGIAQRMVELRLNELAFAVENACKPIELSDFIFRNECSIDHATARLAYQAQQARSWPTTSAISGSAT